MHPSFPNLIINLPKEAFKWALQVAESLGLSSVQIEIDCLECVQALLNSSKTINWVIAEEIRSCLELATSFVFCSFSWAPRLSNRAPHVSGRWALKNYFAGWIPLPGPGVFSAVVREYSS